MKNNWILPLESMPKIDQKDDFNKRQKIFVRVLVIFQRLKLEGYDEKEPEIQIAQYHYNANCWIIQGYIRQIEEKEIKGWQYLPTLEKAFQS